MRQHSFRSQARGSTPSACIASRPSIAQKKGRVAAAKFKGGNAQEGRAIQRIAGDEFMCAVQKINGAMHNFFVRTVKKILKLLWYRGLTLRQLAECSPISMCGAQILRA